MTRSLIEEYEEAGLEGLDFDEMRELRNHKVTPLFVEEMAELGLEDLDVDDLVELRIHKVSPSYVH